MAERFEKLREQLELQEWPNVFFFKFIAPNNSEIIAKITAHFDDGADLQYHTSREGKYVSISVKELMMDVDSIIDRYKKISVLDGVIAL